MSAVYLGFDPARDRKVALKVMLPQFAADAALMSQVEQLRAHLLSPDEMNILRDSAAHEPCSGSSVQGRCKPVVGKSEFCAVWGLQRGRRAVAREDD